MRCVVGKLNTRALITVVEHDIDAFRSQLFCNAGSFFERLALLVERDDRNFVRCDRNRPNDTMLVVMLLDDRGKGARDTDAIATHVKRLLASVLVGKRGTHFRGVLRTDLEYLTAFDASAALQGFAAVRTRISGFYRYEVLPCVHREVAIWAGTRVVVINLVGAARPALRGLKRCIADQTDAIREDRSVR